MSGCVGEMEVLLLIIMKINKVINYYKNYKSMYVDPNIWSTFYNVP